jgi:hypothetical protein
MHKKKRLLFDCDEYDVKNYIYIYIYDSSLFMDWNQSPTFDEKEA